MEVEENSATLSRGIQHFVRMFNGYQQLKLFGPTARRSLVRILPPLPSKIKGSRDASLFASKPHFSGGVSGETIHQIVTGKRCVHCSGQPSPTRRLTLIFANRIPLWYNICGGFRLGYYILS